MNRALPVLLIFLTIGARPGSTQKAGAGLTDQQKMGRQVLMQSCSVCHLPSGPDAKTYGPALNKSTIPADDETARQTILDGTGRMPGFKYFLQPAQVDAIIAYVRTVPPRARPATATQKKNNVDD